MSPSALRELLKDAELNGFREVLWTLVPNMGIRPGSLFLEKPGTTTRGRLPQGYYETLPIPATELRAGAEPIVQVIVEALECEESAIRREAIDALRRIGLRSRGVVPGLVGAFERGPASDRRVIFSTLEQLARVKQEPQPNTYIEVKEEYDLSAIQGEEAIPRLIQALDPRSLNDLSLMFQIYTRFGSAAEVIKPILQKAAEDEDEEVRRNAKAMLEAISSEEQQR
jgi:HEAT repeat protein